MVLTVAQSGQKSVQVDIVRRNDGSDQSVGCLVLEDIATEGESDLEFVLGLDETGTVEAKITDTNGGQYQSFSVRLDQLDIDDTYSLPEDGSVDIAAVESIDEELDAGDFGASGLGSGDLGSDDLSMPDIDLPDTIEDEDDLHASFSDELTSELNGTPDDFDDFEPHDELEGDDEEEFSDEAPSRQFNPLLLAAVLLISLSLLALGAYGVFSWLKGDSLPELRAAVVPFVGALPFIA